MPVDSIFAQQLMMAPALDDLSILKHQDLVGHFHGTKPLGYNECRPALHHALERLLDLVLRLRVHARRRVVEDEDARVHQQRPGNRDPLLLSAGKGDPSLADPCVVAFGEAHDEIVDVCCLGRLPHLLVRRVHGAVSDVVANRRREQKDVLLHRSDRLTQRGESSVADVYVIDRDAAACHVVEARHEVNDGCLAAARWPHERDDLPGLRVDIDARQHRTDCVVAKRNILELHVALHRRKWPRAGLLLDG